jgi:hypothetical protein
MFGDPLTIVPAVQAFSQDRLSLMPAHGSASDGQRNKKTGKSVHLPGGLPIQQ